jgi:hypothetical protein
MNQKHELEYLSVEGHFNTYDLGLSSALVSLGYEIVAIDKTNPRKAQFVFKKQDASLGEIDEDIKRYWDGKLSIDARRLIDNMKMLKNRLYSS